MNVKGIAAAALVAAGLVSAGGAAAQGIIIDQNGVRVAPPMADRVPPPPPANWDNGPGPGGYDRGAENTGIGPREARRIARSAGIVETWGVDRRGPVWVVEGSDRRGRALRVTVSARSGDIVNVDRARRS